MLHISLMTQADLPEVTALAAQLGYPHSLDTYAERFALVSSHPMHKLWVAKEDGRVKGWLHAHPTTVTMINPVMAEVDALVVDESARGTGVGKALLKQAEDWARAEGYEQVRLRSSVTREHAHAFYAAQGYERRKVWGGFFKNL